MMNTHEKNKYLSFKTTPYGFTRLDITHLALYVDLTEDSRKQYDSCINFTELDKRIIKAVEDFKTNKTGSVLDDIKARKLHSKMSFTKEDAEKLQFTDFYKLGKWMLKISSIGNVSLQSRAESEDFKKVCELRYHQLKGDKQP